jgi:hypothetical protein
VSPGTLPTRRAERFARLLDEATGGRRHHLRSRVDEELTPLVAVAHRVAAVNPSVEIDPDFRTGLRAYLVATAEREATGRAAPARFGQRWRSRVTRVAADRRPPTGPRTTADHPGRPSTRGRARGAIIVGVAVGAIAVSGMSAASENAMPGDALYSVKRSTEKAQLALAGSEVTRGQLHLDFARQRAREALTIRDHRAGFSGALADMDADTRQGTELLTTAAVQRRDPAALDALGAFVREQRVHVGGLVGLTVGADRSRALASLDLLDQVQRRAERLRTVLRCGSAGTAGSDSLGPKPQHCSAAADPTAPRTDPENTPGQRPAGAGAATPTRPAPADSPATTAAPPEPGEPADDGGGLLGAIGRILDGLLG